MQFYVMTRTHVWQLKPHYLCDWQANQYTNVLDSVVDVNKIITNEVIYIGERQKRWFTARLTADSARNVE